MQTSRFPYPLILVPAPFRWLLPLYPISAAKHYTTLCNLGHFSDTLGIPFSASRTLSDPSSPLSSPSPNPLLLPPTFCSCIRYQTGKFCFAVCENNTKSEPKDHVFCTKLECTLPCMKCLFRLRGDRGGGRTETQGRGERKGQADDISVLWKTFQMFDQAPKTLFKSPCVFPSLLPKIDVNFGDKTWIPFL